MNHFLEHILARHSNTDNAIQPRLAGRFEGSAIGNKEMNEEVGDKATMSPIQSINIFRKEATGITMPASVNDTVQPPVSSNDQQSQLGEKIISSNGEINKPVTNNIFQPIQSIVQDNSTTKVIHEQLDDPFVDKVTDSDMIKSNDYQESLLETKVPVSNFLQDFSQPSFLQNPVIPQEAISLPSLQTNQSTSIIKVSIGRIDVRANTVAGNQKVPSNTPVKSRTSLDEYLKKRNGA